MAKIVTITNPLTGQPTQVDQLDNTAQQIDNATGRAITSGIGAQIPDTTLTTLAEVNAIKKTGWYYYQNSSTPLVGDDQNTKYMMIRHESCGSEYDVQYGYNLGGDVGVSCAYDLRRAKSKGTWQPWEYVNPPMLDGVEYRTTERFRGKPVYAMTFSPSGGLTDGQTITYPLPSGSVDWLVRGIMHGSNQAPAPYIHSKDLANSWSYYANFQRNNCVTNCGTSAAGQSYHITIYYTKQ